jgi:hypothetical protein
VRLVLSRGCVNGRADGEQKENGQVLQVLHWFVFLFCLCPVK